VRDYDDLLMVDIRFLRFASRGRTTGAVLDNLPRFFLPMGFRGLNLLRAAADAFWMLEQTWVKVVSFAELEDAQMKLFLMAFAAALVSSTFALADTPVTPAEAEKIKAALQVLGCTGGKMEKETEASGYFEVDDAKCKDGQYDIKLDKDFKLIAMTRD
jgi:hypothetical protein